MIFSPRLVRFWWGPDLDSTGDARRGIYAADVAPTPTGCCGWVKSEGKSSSPAVAVGPRWLPRFSQMFLFRGRRRGGGADVTPGVCHQPSPHDSPTPHKKTLFSLTMRIKYSYRFYLSLIFYPATGFICRSFSTPRSRDRVPLN
jgi:hypothetical protein